MKSFTKKLFFFISLIFIGCGEDKQNSQNQTCENNIIFNPIIDANVEISEINGTKIYSTTTYKNNLSNNLITFDKDNVGEFNLSDFENDKNRLVLVKVDNINSNKGALYTYAYTDDLENNKVIVNEFTTLTALFIKNNNLLSQNQIKDILYKTQKQIFINPNTPLYSFDVTKYENCEIKDLSKLKNKDTLNNVLYISNFDKYLENNESLFVDSDKDGLFDAFEIFINSNLDKKNSDDDGVDDYGEFIAGDNLLKDDIADNIDELFTHQWHLKNTAQTAGADNSGINGYDINITDIWKYNTGNKKIKIAVIDTGIQSNHPDLDTQIDTNLSYRYSDDSNNPSPDDNQLDNDPYGAGHGTAVAGIIAAKSFNQIGISGISPSSTLVGLNVFSNNTESSFLDALSKDVNVSSNSWGVSSSVVWEDSLMDLVIKTKSLEGTIFVFAAGNDRYEYEEIDNTKYYFGNANNGCVLNNKYTIVVAAMDANGTYSSYSSFGDNVLVSAPAGEFGYNYPAIVTTDLSTQDYGFDNDDTHWDIDENNNSEYTNHMNGTSAATPMVSGIVALMLNVNSNLTYREIKYILASTARKIDSNNSDWQQNDADIWFNRNYGFGLVDGGTAIEMAKDFSLPEEKITDLYSKDVNISIPDNDEDGINVSIDIDENISIEYVNAWVSVDGHDFLGDLEIDLVSPAGTVSKLSYGGKYYLDGVLDNKRYGSNKFFKEYSKGTWKLIVKDLNPDNEGNLTNFSIKIYGH